MFSFSTYAVVRGLATAGVLACVCGSLTSGVNQPVDCPAAIDMEMERGRDMLQVCVWAQERKTQVCACVAAAAA